jgi:hypothetical protein
MKKIISVLTVLSMTAACGISAVAADKEKGEPDVFVDNSKILFEDQNAVIVDDITLVPARGVFEAMGCKVDWNGTDRTVTVTSSTGVRYAVITIDSDVMRVSTYKSLMERNDEEVKLEVPAKIINERTMIPLRAVSEAFDCDVDWNGDDYAVNITTGDPLLLNGYTYTAPAEDSLVNMSLSTDHEGALNAGDEFTVYVNVENFPDEASLSGIVATFEYDSDKFEYVEGSGSFLNDQDEKFEASMAVENSEYDKGAKIAFVTIEDEKERKTDGKVYECKFKSLNGESGTINLANDFTSIFGYESYVMFTQDGKDVEYDGKNLNLDQTPLVIGE